MQLVVIGTLALIPLLFLPLTQDMFIPIKWTVLVMSACTILVLWAIRLARTGQSDLAVSRTSLGFGALSIASLFSLAFASNNRVDGLLDQFGPPTWTAWTVLLSFASSSFSRRAKTVLTWTVLLVASALAVTSIMAHLQLLPVERSWSPLGTIVVLPWFALGCLPLLIKEGGEAWKRRDAILIFCVFLVAATLVASVSFFALLPAGDKISLPFAEAWRIFAQTFSVPLRALFGIGIENYTTAFTQGRSALLNTSPIWNIRFTESSSLILHIGTTMGALGIVGLILLARSLTQITKGVLILVLLLAPPSLPILALIVAVYLATSSDTYKSIPIRISSHLSWLRVGSVVVAVGLSSAGIYAVGRAFASELLFMRSLVARAAGNGQATYDLQIQAISANPWNTRYRIAYSQTNLDIANAIAPTNQNSPSQADRQTTATLIQQAIREAKTAVSLSPNNILAWENIARLYQSLTSVAQGADQWAVASYQQTIALDPTNPLLRVSYANLLEARGDTDAAFIQYQTATSLKPDYALAHYNLARIYRQRQQYALEAQALAETLKLLQSGSQDEEQVQSELEEAKSHLPTEASPGALP